MLEVDEDLDYLAEILGREPLNEGLADFFGEELVEGFLELRVDYGGVLEVVVGEEVELV